MKLNELIENIESNYLKSDLPLLKIGHFISIDILIQEGNKKRIQSYNGKIIFKHSAGINSTITVKKLSKGISIERIFPIHSPDIKSIKIIN
jgi:large subunit ribosomal protein L19